MRNKIIPVHQCEMTTWSLLRLLPATLALHEDPHDFLPSVFYLSAEGSQRLKEWPKTTQQRGHWAKSAKKFFTIIYILDAREPGVRL